MNKVEAKAISGGRTLVAIKFANGTVSAEAILGLGDLYQLAADVYRALDASKIYHATGERMDRREDEDTLE